MSVNNFDLIRPLLHWDKEGDYYYVQIYQRKKDKSTTFGNKNNSFRLVKTYCFYDIESFNLKEIEMIKLADLFTARVGINLNKRNDENIAFKLLRAIVEAIATRNFKVNGILNTINGAPSPGDKIWLLDCDTQEEYDGALEVLQSSDLKPDYNKILAILPTYSSHHIITRKFDSESFLNKIEEKGLKIDIHKNNPTCLYYPNRDD